MKNHNSTCNGRNNSLKKMNNIITEMRTKIGEMSIMAGWGSKNGQFFRGTNTNFYGTWFLQQPLLQLSLSTTNHPHNHHGDQGWGQLHKASKSRRLLQLALPSVEWECRQQADINLRKSGSGEWRTRKKIEIKWLFGRDVWITNLPFYGVWAFCGKRRRP